MENNQQEQRRNTQGGGSLIAGFGKRLGKRAVLQAGRAMVTSFAAAGFGTWIIVGVLIFIVVFTFIIVLSGPMSLNSASLETPTSLSPSEHPVSLSPTIPSQPTNQPASPTPTP